MIGYGLTIRTTHQEKQLVYTIFDVWKIYRRHEHNTASPVFLSVGWSNNLCK